LANGYGYSSGYGAESGYGTDSGYGTGSADTYAKPYSDASSTGGDNSSPVAARDTEQDRQHDGDAVERAYQVFDRARHAFMAGDYAAAFDLTDEALKGVPGDPLVHEFKALVLFARGEDPRAAAVLHAVLAVRSGMNWATLCGLYPDVETYTGQLRALEDRCRRDPKAAAPHFVLAYHYLAAGHNDAAVAQLKALITLEPGDRVARRLLAALNGTPPTPEPTTTRAVPDRDGAAGRPPSADLHGRSRGKRDGSTSELSLHGATEYSNGTIYQHFSTKEDLITALAVESSEQRLALLTKARKYRGRSRERMLALGVADDLFVRLFPHFFRSELVIHMAGLESRASSSRRETLTRQDQCIAAWIQEIVQEAVEVGDLLGASTSTAGDVAISLFSMAIGTHLCVVNLPQVVEQLGVASPQGTLRDSGQALLDGLGWRPLRSEWDYGLTHERILREVFADEWDTARRFLP
jgi:AcrR family transcriptional regulator